MVESIGEAEDLCTIWLVFREQSTMTTHFPQIDPFLTTPCAQLPRKTHFLLASISITITLSCFDALSFPVAYLRLWSTYEGRPEVLACM